MEKRLASRRVPDELRKRTFASCDTCRKRRCKCIRRGGSDQDCVACQRSGIPCVSSYQRKTRLYGSVETIRDRIHCLEAIVKGVFPGEPVDSISALLELGRKAGYEMPKLDLPQQNENERRVELRSSESAYQTLTCASNSNDQPGCIRTSQRPPQLVKDSRGHSHYIGPSASLAFFADLRSLVSEQQPSSCFAADTLTESLEARQDSSRLSPSAVSTGMTPLARDEELSFVKAQLQEMPRDCLLAIIHAFFHSVNSDFPLLDRGYFFNKLESYIYPIGPAEGLEDGWVACIHAVLAFGCWILDDDARFEADELSTLRSRCWNLARGALAGLLTSCTVSNIQALLLMALFLHNNNDRNAAWTLTGSAARIAIALGLHRSDIDESLRLTEQDSRRRVWSTLFTFEQFLCLCLGRPSVIDSREVTLGPAPEVSATALLGHPSHHQVATDLQQQVSRLRDAIAFLHRPASPVSSADTQCTDPISLLSNLKTWEAEIPTYLIIPSDILDTCITPSTAVLKAFVPRYPPDQLRPTVLLHLTYNNLLIQLTRPYLLTVISMSRRQNPKQQYPWTLPRDSFQNVQKSAEHLASSCVTAAMRIVNLLVLLDYANGVNGKTGLDLFYGYSAGMVLLLRRLWVMPPDLPKSLWQLEGAAQKDVQCMVTKLQSIMQVNAKCPTMQRFNAVLQKFDEAVLANGQLRERGETDEVAPLGLAQGGGIDHVPSQLRIPCVDSLNSDLDGTASDSPSLWQESLQTITQYSLDWSNFEQFLGSINVA
ncbi:transcriptional regulator family: Fungal Specific TF [Aspergillus niger]|nr:transcriptional regulator family: Fungal Specific TF [Aspergillus niger]KAI2842481.1 transcriptional regulator family: Fungal Specific TF [Aspergillus niger]KAI2846395.1 transcriptional regulator family: Fungal Specific TF [Aspergillus niger]KAI2880145.1 transcriptional regulator family: Fungal Specific TF [Aspergillus niger]KAI2897783.1 transcriptional regulator family: Fungal Specific TF [Aspergillus niger]